MLFKSSASGNLFILSVLKGSEDQINSSVTLQLFVGLGRFFSFLDRILVGKSEGKKPLGRPRRKWIDNTRIDLGEIKWNGVDWIDVAQDRAQ
jgi:hypothetical protein